MNNTVTLALRGSGHKETLSITLFRPLSVDFVYLTGLWAGLDEEYHPTSGRCITLKTREARSFVRLYPREAPALIRQYLELDPSSPIKAIAVAPPTEEGLMQVLAPSSVALET